MKKLKYWLIKILDRNPDYCWASLVEWAEGVREFKTLFIQDHDSNDYKTQICRKSNKDTPFAWCGKCEHTGRYQMGEYPK